MTALIVLTVALVVGLIIRGVRAANRRTEVAGFEAFAQDTAPSFPLQPGEVVQLTLAARDLRAARRLENDAIADEYPSSFPRVTCTSNRLVIQMSVTDKTTDLAGSYPPRLPDLRRRIGEQFVGAERLASSCEWPWETISSIIAEGDTAGLLWQGERGSGAVMLTFMSVSDQARSVSVAIAAIAAVRGRLGLLPTAPVVAHDGGGSEYSFPGARVLCSECGSVILADDSYCTGCGVRIFRFAAAES
jgi:hypothetical protein